MNAWRSVTTVASSLPISRLACSATMENPPGTRTAFERAVECGNDAAARCLYAEWLMAQPQPDDREQARSLFASIIDDAQHWSRHARSHNAAWLERTKVALQGY